MSEGATSPYRRVSLWWDQLPAELAGPVRPALPGSMAADVAIVGAGLTGLWTAYYLLRRDPSLRVVLLEAEVAGFGASGRNGGWCSALFPTPIDKLAAASSREAAVALFREMQRTVDEVGTVAGAEGIDAAYRKGGTVVLARTPLQLARARAEVTDWHSWGFDDRDLRLLSQGEAHELLGATDVLGATYTPHCAAIQPARLVRGLALAVERLGATLHERTHVTSIEPGVARTGLGEVRAHVVVRATEGYTPRLAGARRELLPVYSSMIATEPLPAAFWERTGLRRAETFSDFRSLIIYGQRTADDRLAFGGRGAPYHFGSRVDPAFDRDAAVSAHLQAVLTDLLPDLAGHAITHSWGGPLGVSRDWFPSVGLDRDNGLAWAGGYVGDGVATTNLAGRTLADLIAGVDSPLVRLPWVGHRSRRWEPEPLRWLGANVVLRGMTYADRAEARTGKPSQVGRLVDRLAGH